MKLLFVLPEFGPAVKGGIATYYHHIVPALVKAGHQVDVCVPTEEGTTTTSAGQAGVGLIVTTPSQRRRATEQFAHLAAVPELVRTLAVAFAGWEACNRGQDHEIVEVTDAALLYVPWLLSTSGPPVIVQLHGSNGQLDFHDPFEGSELVGVITRLIECALLGRADELQSYGTGNVSEWSRLLNRPVRHLWPAFYVGTGPVAIPPLEFGSDGFGLAVGRIQRWKGPEMLCQAVRLLGDRAPHIAWVGRDHPFRTLGQSMSEYLKEVYPEIWGQRVLPLGERSRDGTAGIQAAASFVVVPSIWDVFNLAAVEAMAASKVVICSDGAGAAQLIEHGVNGFRFPAGDVAKLAELLALVSALSPIDRSIIGRSARRTIQQKLDVTSNAEQRMKHFARLKNTPRQFRGDHPWLENFFAGRHPSTALAFLDKLPLRAIAKYAARRGIHRLRARSK